VASGIVPISAPLLFTANDCLDFGVDLGSPVSVDYFDEAPFRFNGTIAGASVDYLPPPSRAAAGITPKAGETDAAKQLGQDRMQTTQPIPVAD
jgi:hypothetical protein